MDLKSCDSIKEILFETDNVYIDHNDCSYINGNYLVQITKHYFNDEIQRTKTLFSSEDTEFTSEFPDSIDLKITNKCSWGCPFCHESSSITGNSFNLERTKQKLLELPQVPIEIAIGGGNILECSDTIDFLKWINTKTVFQPRVTINYQDVLKEENKFLYRELSYLSGNIGISIPSVIINGSDITSLFCYDERVTYHIIAGIFPEEELGLLTGKNDHPILILGYKQFGRASNLKFPKEKLKKFEQKLKEILNNESYNSTIAFDNLAIEQLHLDNSVIPNWNRLFLGGEGKHSIYIDAVNETYAKTSRSEKRVSWNDMSLLEFFKLQRDDSINY